MKQNTYQNLTNEQLIKKRNSLKGASIGFALLYFLAIVVLIYLLTTKGFKNFSIATLIPLFIMPITFIPLLISLNLMNKELKKRN
ncbi:hypothetical protein LZZ90_10750 [Flavobacterium sp. SM15]|uniref:hypothetical protein n=1 Tax=Flavobacterium sp. SM15 TaxID=2908005 RepID=UPI001EDA0E63|nr:hypothetical protein [Flavobacterium sp. SM15]MCG2611985.1 hypothetical protein [Flavobacterium sp. SM15]